MMTKVRVQVPLFLMALVLLLCLAPSVAQAYAPFDTWYEKAKATAFSADHVIGPGGDIGASGNPYTIVMPGETIGVCPEAGLSEGPYYAVGAYATISYSFTQFEHAVADYTYLPRSKKPAAKLTKVKTETVKVPYEAYGTIVDWEDGKEKLPSFDYTSIYRNDTGLPILISSKNMGKALPPKEGAKAYPKDTPPNYVQASVTRTEGVTLSFLEPSYLVNLKAMVGETAVNTSELYWNHTTHAVPASIPKSYVYAKHGTQTYTLAHPIMKGCEFSLWRGTYLNEYGQEEIHPLGGLTGYKTKGYEGILGAESSTYKIDFPLYQNKASVMLMRARDINLTAKFTKSDSSHTIGFNPEGGTVKGAKYYIAEDAGFNLDVNTIKPVRAGHTFEGWCTNKANPGATMVTGSGSGTNIYGTTADNNHTELYAVWSAGSPEPTPTPSPSGEIWERLYGDNAYGTMAAIAQKGWTTSDTVVVATFSGYWDALAASSLAGLYHAPILLTDIDSLNPVTQQQIVRLKAKKAVIVGGKAVVTDKVKKKIESLGLSVERVAGDNAQLTALEVAKSLGAHASKTCIVATSDGYWDALAASPYAYKEKAPIYLTQPDGTLHPDVAKAIKAGGYERAVIVGGTVVVAPSMEKTLANLGIGTVVRKSGGIAIETSRDFASWAIGNGMGANYMAVATVNDFYDALTGGPLCGLHNGVLVLASNENTSNTVIPAKYKSNIAHAYLLGGPAALGDSVLDAFRAATRASASLRSI